jgi:hypothetical protein
MPHNQSNHRRDIDSEVVIGWSRMLRAELITIVLDFPKNEAIANRFPSAQAKLSIKIYKKRIIH